MLTSAGHSRRALLSRRLARQPRPLSLIVERMVVAREGLEPSKPLGRQIYSLLRLTASLPRRLAVLFGNAMFRSYSKDPDVLTVKPMELAEGFEPTTL